MLNKIVHKFLYRVGYTKLEYVKEANNRTSAIKQKLKNTNLQLDQVYKDRKKYKKKYNYEKSQKEYLERELVNPKHIVDVTNNKLKSWSKKIKHNKTCDICGSKEDIQSHHVYPKSLIPALAYNESNGVPLCGVCHNEYHDKYDILNCNWKTYISFKEGGGRENIKLGFFQRIKNMVV